MSTCRASWATGTRHIFIKGSIGDFDLVAKLLAEYQPRAIINFAAESHVDRSIHGPEDFIQTNIVGTFHLLEAVRAYWNGLEDEAKASFRFLHVSTDEVYGSLAKEDPAFAETNRYEPNSPYSASKAASDHLVRAYHHTYGLPVLTTNCSNNYGPYCRSMVTDNKSATGSTSKTIAAQSAASSKPANLVKPITLVAGTKSPTSTLSTHCAPFLINLAHAPTSSPTKPRSPTSRIALVTTDATPSTPARSRTWLETSRNLRNGHPKNCPVVSRQPILGKQRDERCLPELGWQAILCRIVSKA